MNNVTAIPTKKKALDSVRRGVAQSPPRVLIYGSEKVGKSTFAAGAPKPIFLGAESGTERLSVDRLEPSNWEEAVSWVHDLAVDKHDYETLVVDPLNWLEPLCHAAVVGPGGGNIADYGGGYGKGPEAARGLWRVFLFELERCWKRGMAIVLTAHSQVKPFSNPEGAPYDRYELAMNDKAAGIFKQWVDAVLFARLETFTKIDPATKKAKGFSSGARVLHTQPCAAYDAGTRWKLPEEIPLSWDDFASAVQAEHGRAADLATQIAALTTELADAEITKFAATFVEKNRGNADKLAELVNRLGLKLENSKAKASA